MIVLIPRREPHAQGVSTVDSNAWKQKTLDTRLISRSERRWRVLFSSPYHFPLPYPCLVVIPFFICIYFLCFIFRITVTDRFCILLYFEYYSRSFYLSFHGYLHVNWIDISTLIGFQIDVNYRAVGILKANIYFFFKKKKTTCIAK